MLLCLFLYHEFNIKNNRKNINITVAIFVAKFACEGCIKALALQYLQTCITTTMFFLACIDSTTISWMSTK